MVRRALPTGAWRETFIEKRQKPSKAIFHCLKASWLFVIGCPWCFHFITLKQLQAFGFGLLREAAKALEPPQSDGFLV